MHRIIILVGIGVLLIGGWFLANRLFLTPPPPASTSARSVPPMPPVTPPPQAGSTKEEAPLGAAPARPPAIGEPKAAPETGGTQPTPPVAGKAAPGKEASPEKSSTSSKSEAKAAQPTVSFSLQIGAMVMEANAEKLKRRLEESGFPSLIRKGNAFVTKQVVTVGEPSGRREAEDLARRLNVDGFPSQVVAVRGAYSPQIGTFFDQDEAIDLARELQKRNYHPKITSKPESTVVFQVRHGRFDSRAAAVRRGEDLKAKGFNFLVVRD